MIVISAIYNEKRNAGPKAPADIDKILEKKYNAKKIVIVRNKTSKFKIIIKLIKIAIFNRKEILVIQFPLINFKFIYKILNRNKVIILIHDINGLRFNNKKMLGNEIENLKQFKYIIAHNKTMINFLEKQGIEKEKIYNLQVFDYLAEGKINEKEKENKKKIIYTGNLKKEKSPFIYELEDNKMKFDINLYGLGITKDISEKIKYKGSFEPERINDLDGNFRTNLGWKYSKK